MSKEAYLVQQLSVVSSPAGGRRALWPPLIGVAWWLMSYSRRTSRCLTVRRVPQTCLK
jgi:hypothetical protein